MGLLLISTDVFNKPFRVPNASFIAVQLLGGEQKGRGGGGGRDADMISVGRSQPTGRSVMFSIGKG